MKASFGYKDLAEHSYYIFFLIITNFSF